MIQLALAKLIVDGLLVASVIFLAMRALRNQGVSSSIAGNAARELRDLEISLKTLLRDADVSSQGLNSSLSRQQRNLEQLLSDITATERRVGETIDSASREAARFRQDALITAERFVAADPQPIRTRRQASAMQASASVKPDLIEDTKIFDEPMAAMTSLMETAAVAPRRLSPGISKPAKSAAVNVFGEPIGTVSQVSQLSHGSSGPGMRLDNEELTAPPTPRRTPHPTPQQVSSRNHADAALEAPIREVVAQQIAEREAPQRTKAPIYRQQRLAQQVEVERAVESLAQAKQAMNSLAKQKQSEADEFTADELPQMQAGPVTQPIDLGSEQEFAEGEATSQESASPTPIVERDPRLGVLGTVRRHTQVL